MLGGKGVQKKPPSLRGSRPSFCWSGSFFSTCLRRLFFDPFCVVGCPKKNLGSGGAGVAFSGQAFFRPFWNSPLSDVWVPT